MRFSYSKVQCFGTCAYQFKLRYKDKYTTLPDQDPNNALYMGLGLHKGIETTVEEGVADYQGRYYVLTDEIINNSIQLEYWIPKVKELLPENGKHEVQINAENYIGYIDYVTDDTIYDFKFTKDGNIPRYLESPQLSIYKHFYEKTNPKAKIKHLKYIFVPKTAIRQRKDETIQQFRNRLIDTMNGLEIKVVEVPFNSDSVTQFKDECKRIEKNTEYPKQVSKLCDYCEFNKFCLEGETYDMKLPSSERRKIGSITKRTMWLYGRPFTGKTTLADGAPNPLMLNTDGNVTYVTAPFVPIKDDVKMNGRMKQTTFGWQVFKEAIEELEKGENDFKTIVVDLLEDTYEMCRLYMYDKLKITHESDDSYRAWDKVRTEYLSTMRKLTNLNYENIILLSHEDATKDITKKSGENITSIKPNINDKCAMKIAGMVDIVGRVVADNGKRTIQFQSDDVVFGGGRLEVKNSEIPLSWDAVVELFDEANKNNKAKA